MTIRGYPLPIFGLCIFLALLNVNFKYEVALGIFVLTVCLSSIAERVPSLWSFFKCHWPVVVFLAIGVISSVLSLDRSRSFLMMASLLPGLLCYVTIVLFANNVRERLPVYGALLLLALSICYSVFIGLESPLQDPIFNPVKYSGSLILVVPNDVLLLVMICPLATVLWPQFKWVGRALIVAIWLLTFASALALASRQGVILVAVAAGVMALFISPKRLLPALLAVVAAALLWEAHRGWLLLAKVQDFSRSYVWHAGWEMFKDYPIWGVGPGGFKNLYLQYVQKAGYLLSSLPDQRLMPWVHNLYLEQFVERGVLGGLAFLCVLGASCQRLSKMAEAKLANPVERLGLLSCWVVLLAAALGELTLQRLWVSVMLFTLMGLTYVATRNS